MIFDILKRDLKRKKTMNVILLLFMILSVMFVSSSINSMLSVTSSLDSMFDKAGVGDYLIATVGTESENEIDEKIGSMSCVSSYKKTNILYLNENSIKENGRILDLTSTGILCSIDDTEIKLFDKNKMDLKEVNDGEIYMKRSFMDENNVKDGSRLSISVGGLTKEFTIKGSMIDAIFGSDMMGTPRFIISRKDFDEFSQNITDIRYGMTKGFIYSLSTSDTAAVQDGVSGINGVSFMASRDLLKTTYIMDMIIAATFLIVSVCLIIISVVILRFTIGFTISEEYREIGVMKAIGIKNSSIRGLYMVKYLAMALVGAVIGFFAGIPFGNMMTEMSSKNFTGSSYNSYLLNLLCSAAVFGLIGLFTWFSTRKVKKFTPVDAIRSGETGKRYKKKGLMKLSKSRKHPVFFMALNDILSGFRHFAVMTITFVAGILMLTILLNTITTLQSPKLLTWFSMAECDVALEDKAATEKFTVPEGQTMRTDYLKDMEKNLAENDIPAKCFSESLFKFAVTKGDKKAVTLVFIGANTTTDMYSYIEGTPPENENEIALSYIVADNLGAKVGDTVKVKTGSEYEEFIVTATYQSMNNMGEGLRFNENKKLDFSKALGFFGYQIRYTDNPSEGENQSRFEKIKELYPEYIVRTGGEFVDYSIGGIAKRLAEIKNFVLIVVMLINIFVVVLMEKSFLTKERGEIALLKALGFRNRSIIIWQTLRIMFIMASAVLIAVLLTEPVSQLAISGIFRIMGAKYIIFDVNIIETYIFYPLTVFAVTVLSALLSTFGIRGISSQEVNNIE